jgi:hypothetical protein
VEGIENLSWQLCQQCAVANLGADIYSFAGRTTPSDTDAGTFAEVNCSKCGPTLVDHAGRCVAIDCDLRHGERA